MHQAQRAAKIAPVISMDPRDPLISATLVVVRDIPKSFAKGLTTQNLGVPDHDMVCEQQRSFTDSLQKLGIRVVRLPADEANPDSQFPRDTIVSYKGVMLSCNPGSEKRRKEVEPNVRDLGALGMPVQRVSYGSGAFVEGGDVLTFENHSLVVVGFPLRYNNVRTTPEGIGALARELRTIDSDVTVVAVPFVSLPSRASDQPSMILHLETGFTPMSASAALRDPQCRVEWGMAYDALNGSRVQMPIWSVTTLKPSDAYAAHVLPINGSIVIAKGFHAVREMAAAHYEQVIEVDMTEARKMDGSLRCWTILHNEQ